MRFGPDVWGPLLWKLIHAYSLNYPVTPTAQDRLKARTYYYAIPRFIPCPTCAAHFQEILDRSPPITDSRAALSEWTYDAHNAVNTRIGKPIFTVEDFMRLYSPTIKENQPVPSASAYFVGAAVSGVFHSIF
jgi:FAD-linked sulfhydryl oxidase